MKALLSVLAILSVAASSFGDIVYLKGGGRFEGRVTDLGERIQLEMAKGKMVISQSQILRIEKKRHILDDYDERAAKAGEDDVQAQLKLARWCQLNGLDAQSKKHYKQVLIADEKNEEAAKALGIAIKSEPAAEPKKADGDQPKTAAEPKEQAGEKKGGVFDLEGAGLASSSKKPGGTALDEAFKGLKLRASEQDVIASFGEPEQRKKYDTGQCQLGLFYSALGFAIFIDTRGVYAYNINSPNWRLKSGIRLGDPIENVFRYYGMYKKRISGKVNQPMGEYPTLITDPDSGNQVVRYDTGYCFWAHASGEIYAIRVTLETLNAPGQGAGQPQTALPVQMRPQLWTWERVMGQEPVPKAISRKEALDDLARFREVVEQAYCGYDYFAKQGHDWEKTFTKLRAAVEKRASWAPADLARLLADALRFTGDRHFIFSDRTAKRSESFPVGRHQHAYFADMVVARTDDGLKVIPADPKTIGPGTWFLLSCEGHEPQQHLFRTLDPQHGREVYLLGLCSEEPARALTVRLRSTSGQKRERTLPLHRNRMADYKPDRSSVFTYTVQPFPILQVTTFDIKGSMPSVRQKLEEFETTGSRPELRNSPYVLVDVRGNGGGQDIPGPTWLDALTDEPTKTCFVDRLRSPLVYEAMLNMELSRHAKVGGGTKDSFEALRSAFLRGEVPPAERDYAVDRRQWNASESHVRQSSKVPSHFAGMLLVLYDAKTGSAAENFIQQARQLERAVTLGENSAGMCNFGDCISYYLPNSTVRFQCGHKLIRDETGEMREGIGYLPDYWFDDPDPLGLIVKNVVLLKPHPGD